MEKHGLFASTCRISYFWRFSTNYAGNGRKLKDFLQNGTREVCILHKEKARNVKKLYEIILQNL